MTLVRMKSGRRMAAFSVVDGLGGFRRVPASADPTVVVHCRIWLILPWVDLCPLVQTLSAFPTSREKRGSEPAQMGMVWSVAWNLSGKA